MRWFIMHFPLEMDFWGQNGASIASVVSKHATNSLRSSDDGNPDYWYLHPWFMTIRGYPPNFTAVWGLLIQSHPMCRLLDVSTSIALAAAGPMHLRTTTSRPPYKNDREKTTQGARCWENCGVLRCNLCSIYRNARCEPRNIRSSWVSTRSLSHKLAYIPI